MNNTRDVNTFEPPVFKSELQLTHELFVQFMHPKPNWWWRLWQWILLGWRWKDVKQDH